LCFIADVDTSLCSLYPEFCEPNLSMQLRTFRSQNSYVNVNAAQKVLQSIHPEVRKLYPQVEQLIRLLLICPVTSCTSERSFSSLWRLKTWLRTTMIQSRLNAVAICNIHWHLVDNICVDKLAVLTSVVRFRTLAIASQMRTSHRPIAIT